MEYLKYIDEQKNIQNLIIQFLKDEDGNEENFEQIIDFINIKQNDVYSEFMHVIDLILHISLNHHRNSSFFTRIFKILDNISELIKNSFSNLEIFNIFKRNKLILLFLFENKTITFDYNIYIEMKQIGEINNSYKNYCQFFYLEIKQMVEAENIQNINISQYESENTENFDENRHLGENNSYICSLIRQDSVEEFIAYINLAKISPSSTIKTSLFETNQFLLEKEPSLIEYSAFFGSIQIFKYLHFYKAEITPALWLYAIHGQNAELIHFLESENLNPPEDSYELCFLEAIKCHHNDFAEYICDVLMQNESNQPKLSLKTVFGILYYHNYCFFHYAFNQKINIFDLCRCNYYNLVDILIKDKEDIIKKNIDCIEKKNFFCYQIPI